MNPTIDLVALVQRDREREIQHGRNARLVACQRACCSESRIDRLARALRVAPQSC